MRCRIIDRSNIADDDEAADRHLGAIAAGIPERGEAAADAGNRLLAALEQGESATADPSSSVLTIGRDIDRRMRLLDAFQLDRLGTGANLDLGFGPVADQLLKAVIKGGRSLAVVQPPSLEIATGVAARDAENRRAR